MKAAVGALGQRCPARGPRGSAVLPQPWAALGRGHLWLPLSLSLGRELLETAVIGKPKVNSPASPWGPGVQGLEPAAWLRLPARPEADAEGWEPWGRRGHRRRSWSPQC